MGWMAEALHRSIDPGRTEWKVRDTTEPGVMPGDGSEKEKSWHENLEGRVCFVSDLGLFATCVR